jgi:hypothetical protein
MSAHHRDGSRRLQDQFDTRRLADRLGEKFSSSATIGADDRAFIEGMNMFAVDRFRRRAAVATASQRGREHRGAR